MSELSTNITENTTPKTSKKIVVAAKPKRTIDDVSLNERVAIDNLYGWTIGFRASESERDILIAPYVKNFKQLTVAEVDAQVKLGNIAFCGTDSYGSHAAFRIIDPVIREYIFGEDINPVQLTEEKVKELFAIDNKKSFEKALADLVVTDSEKKMIVILAEKIGIDDVVSFKLSAIEKLSGIKFDH